MFQLTDAALERIIFAMEDQSNTLLINLETGDPVEAALVSLDEREAPGGKFAPPPSWDSRHGFSVLEAFSATVTSPPELKSALNAALRRGRGVFKAFRNALSADDTLFLRFQEFKLRTMRPIVEEWMNAQREGWSLAALKEEPEDIGDLIASEIETLVVPAREAPFNIEAFISECENGPDESLPVSIRTWFIASLLDSLHNEDGLLSLAFATADGSSALMVAFFSMQTPAGALPFCMVRGTLSREDNVGLGIEWQLLDNIAVYSQKLGATQLALEGPLFPASIALEAEEHGFSRSGSILYRAL